jgi:hypothetical protein
MRILRAGYTSESVTVYQAYPASIAEPAIEAQTFVAPFKRGRMTWIKPSFLWMMYRSGWATKAGQERVLEIEITRSGLEWALGHGSLSHYDRDLHESRETWETQKKASPVRIQWDPDRSLGLQPQPWRAIQIGLSGEAVTRYLDDWIIRISDVTARATEIRSHARRRETATAESLLPVERPYPLPPDLARRIGATAG